MAERHTDDTAKRHIALCSGGSDSVAATHAAMRWGPCEEVVYLDTGTGLPENEEWIRSWCDRRDWSFRSVTTTEDYSEKVAEHGYPGPSRHFIFYNFLKDRSLCKIAAETDKELHFWTGIRRQESDRRMRNAEANGTHGNGRWYWHAPLVEWSDADVRAYRERFDLPENPLWDEIGRSADCFCGCFGSREELIDLAAAGFEDHADWLDSLDTPDDCPREQQMWAGMNSDRSEIAKEDDRQMTLCSSCGVSKENNAD